MILHDLRLLMLNCFKMYDYQPRQFFDHIGKTKLIWIIAQGDPRETFNNWALIRREILKFGLIIGLVLPHFSTSFLCFNRTRYTHLPLTPRCAAAPVKTSPAFSQTTMEQQNFFP